METLHVGCVNDLPVAGATESGYGSGAELSMGAFQREGIQRGHYVDILTPKYFDETRTQKYDVLVTKGLTDFHPNQLDLITQHTYIAWPSDYAFTRWRLYFAYQPYLQQKPGLDVWEQFFSNSLFNVFLSPLHKDAYDWALDATQEHPHHLSPPAVREDQFHPHPYGWEPGTVVSVNGLLPFKSLHSALQFCEQHPDLDVTFVGGKRDDITNNDLPDNAEHVGRLPQNQYNELLSRSEVFLSLPATVQPFNRAAMEGFLACKEVMTNQLLGAASYDWFQNGDRKTAREVMRDSPGPFWDRIEDEV